MKKKITGSWLADIKTCPSSWPDGCSMNDGKNWDCRSAPECVDNDSDEAIIRIHSWHR